MVDHMNVLHFSERWKRAQRWIMTFREVKVTKYMEREGSVEIVDNTLTTKDF